MQDIAPPGGADCLFSHVREYVLFTASLGGTVPLGKGSLLRILIVSGTVISEIYFLVTLASA
jgi:hypothetical protein